MKISYNWLQEYFEKELPNPKDLADLLNIRAFEVEEVEEKDGDSIFEIKITPDRAPDCLSHDGIAREVALHTEQPLKQKQILDIESDFTTSYEVEVKEKSTIRYVAREIRNVIVKESPLELKLKLEAIGQRSINTIVDITNLVMFEVGQPMHAFDTDKITGTQILIDTPKQLQIITLDNKEIELTPEDITVQDTVSNLAIAGVKGGKKAEVSMTTINILLESANFSPAQVRKTSKKTGIQNDSSKRFENGLTPMFAEKGIKLASHYIKTYASSEHTQFSNVIDVYPRPAGPFYTGVSMEEIHSKLGVKLSQSEIEEIFERLGFEYSYVNTKDFVIKEIQKYFGVPHNIFPSLTYDAPRSFDCTTLMAYVYARGGKSIPRLTIDQLFFGKEITQADLEPGDLVFSSEDAGIIRRDTIEFLPGTRFERGVDHVGMYVGNGKIVHSSRYTGKTGIEDLASANSFKNIVGYRRIVEKNEMRFSLIIPSERIDIKAGINIIEEIGRIYGYEKIIPIEPTLTSQAMIVSTYDKVNTIKSYLIELGFDEVVTYTFQKKGDVSVIKPLANDKGYLRSNLTKGLTDALELNFKNKELFATEIVKIFEVGHIFTEAGEKLLLGLGVKSATKKQKAKQLLQEALDVLSQKLNIPLLVTIDDQQEVIELELDQLFDKITEIHNSLYALSTKPYTPFSAYPFMTRDIAVWASNSKTRDDIEKVITDNATNFLLRYDLFDTYSTDNKTSYAYRIVFQSKDRTLTDEEVQPIMEKIYSTLQSESDFEIR